MDDDVLLPISRAIAYGLARNVSIPLCRMLYLVAGDYRDQRTKPELIMGLGPRAGGLDKARPPISPPVIQSPEGST